MAIQVLPDGPVPAKVMIVGEAPGEREEQSGRPFCGPSGYELDRMLREAGLNRNSCFVTNVARERPENNDISRFICSTKTGLPVRSRKSKLLTAAHTPLRDLFVTRQLADGYAMLKKEISLVRPNVIIPVGNVSMWALTGTWGIKKWRGSMLYADQICGDADATLYKVIPTYHPAYVLRDWSARAITVNDLRRAARYADGRPYPEPARNFIIAPTYAQAISTLDGILHRLDSGQTTRLSFDIETRAGHIACAGISWTLTDAICLPFMCVEHDSGYWTEDEECDIIFRLHKVLTHPSAAVVGQNILYDSQYTWRWWGFVPRVIQDTMISQHSIFSDMRKSLDFQASMYADYYKFWKDEGKNIDPKSSEDQRRWWYYNCLDCVYTDEVGLAELETVRKLNLEQVHSFQQSLFWPVLQAMQRGVRVDKKRRDVMVLEVLDAIAERQSFLHDMLGHPLNVDSPKQMHTLFYDDLKLPRQFKRAKKGVPGAQTLDDEALQKLVLVEPLLRPIINCIADIRTLGKFLSNFLNRSLDLDGRMRCAFNIGGSTSGASAPKTYRLSSSENAFGSGTNMQTIPSKESKSMGKAASRGTNPLVDAYQFPNIREIFIPDVGFTWFDMDLERADLYSVAWEADDAMLKQAMRLGVDIHLLNAYAILGREPPPLEELIEGSPKYADYRARLKHERQFAKVFCHGTDYGGQPRTMAVHTGRTVHEIDRAQRLWFGAHPGIKQWHDRIRTQVASRRYVENRFGYRWYIFDRPESSLNEAIGWGPQSHTSIVINKIWERIYRELPEVQILLQVHDSLPGQMPTARVAELLPKLRELSKVTIPYDDPLVIPVSIKLSERSWGHC